MNKLGPVISAHCREGSFLNIAKYVFKFPKSPPGPGHFVLCFFVLLFVVTVTGPGRHPSLYNPNITQKGFATLSLRWPAGGMMCFMAHPAHLKAYRGSFPKSWGTFLGVPIIGTITYRGLYWGPLI